MQVPRPSRRSLVDSVYRHRQAHLLNRVALQPYERSDVGLRLRYPTHWNVREGVMGTLVSFVSPPESADDTIRENINVVTQELPQEEVSLASYTAGTIRALQTYNPDLRFAASHAMLIGGKDAYSVTYQEPTILGPIAFRQAWTIINRTAYLFTLTTAPEKFARYNGVFERMLGTATLGK